MQDKSEPPPLSESAARLADKLRSRNARCGVIGLGYVGLPLAVELGHAGFSVVGFDVDQAKVDQINEGKSYIQDVPSDQVAGLVTAGKLCATSDFSEAATLDTVNITHLATLLYGQALDHVVPVGSTQVAEMVKLLENTFRMINIGLVNELALMCDRMGVNVWEVIDAAATKPFGFMPFYPGPGLGGHCIPIDPFYLSWKSKQAGIEARFIELAGYINGQMPHFVVEKIQNALNEHGKPLKGSRIHIMGVAYKKDIDDVRESPALDVGLLQMRRQSEKIVRL
jgi:UDP-N-acetyl-D-mannosaminuronate dehydrogenase